MARPKQFDPDEALDKALEVFWENGYDATSVQDLVDAMEINRFSLYDTYGDKRELYLRSLDRYREKYVAPRLKGIEDTEKGMAAIRGYFRGIIEGLLSGKGWRGCFLINAAVEVAPHDSEAARRIKAHQQFMVNTFHRALEQAAAQGEIRHRRRLKEYAWFLTTTAQGMGVIGKTIRDRGTLESIARQALGSLV